MIAKCEEYLTRLGFRQLRVRYHGDIARIEIEKKDFPRALHNADNIIEEFKRLGFIYITLDLKGYRQGSMNEVLWKT
jgi:uncharacterized protein